MTPEKIAPMAVYLCSHAADEANVTLPPVPPGQTWRLKLDTAAAEPFRDSPRGARTMAAGNAVLLFALTTGAP